jgi:hypothetical protein
VSSTGVGKQGGGLGTLHIKFWNLSLLACFLSFLVGFVEFWSIGYLGIVVGFCCCLEFNLDFWVYFACFV